MTTYYVDNTQCASDTTFHMSSSQENLGTSPENPINSYHFLNLVPGDTILFKRGCVFRDTIISPDGKADMPIRWGAYGDGPAPKFLGSCNLANTNMWRKAAPNIWECFAHLSSEVCNLIFHTAPQGTLAQTDACLDMSDIKWGSLCWKYEDLKKQGDWFYTHIGCTNRPCPEELRSLPRRLFLYSKTNPAFYYSDIECVLFGVRSLATAQHHVNFENIDFFFSGVHGFLGIDTSHISFTNCNFAFIGGAVWQKDRKIRFGNGAEFWNNAKYISIKNCSFHYIYDSCFTTQGGKNYTPPAHIIFANNICSHYGMAAYELRDKITLDTFFIYNHCSNAGEGISVQDDLRPRNSEIYPEPMGHHFFAWRIDVPTENGSVTIAHNHFDHAKHGSCFYTRIPDYIRKQIHFSQNEFE